jgi:hypothetical protein
LYPIAVGTRLKIFSLELFVFFLLPFVASLPSPLALPELDFLDRGVEGEVEALRLWR